ncbi:MAG: cation transporter [Candidatus Eremiobacteraeota bacterium]|nr:cation transporter [Candidatus Eremiobacteraeota bacterium]
MDAPLRARLLKRGLRLEYATLAWNIVGVVLLLSAAFAARSVALAGFGLDSLIEILASIVVVWQLTGVDSNRERRALRLIGAAFFTLAIYVLGQSIYVLQLQLRPSPSPGGIAWLALTVAAMLALAYGKRVTGDKLANPVLSTEARVTFIDAILAFAVLVGLVLNAMVGWWWADPIAGLVIVYYGVREGLHAWNEGA